MERKGPMKRSSWAATLLIVVMVWTGAGLVHAKNVKIGIVDTQRFMKESKAVSEAREMLLKDIISKRALFRQKQEEVLEMEEALKKAQTKKTSAAQLKEKSDELAKEVKNLKRLKTDLEEELNRKNVELTQEILQEVRKIVEEFSKRKKYTVILEKKSIITADEDTDITDEIIRLYDAKASKSFR